MIEKAYNDRDGHIWMDGEFVDWRDAKIHVLTHSLHYGSAVFEGDRAYGGEIFRLDDHSQRLLNSGAELGYEIPFTASQISDACRETLARTGLESAYIRPIAWRGAEKMGVASANNRIHLAVAAWSWGNYFSNKMAGIRMEWSKWRRPAPDTIPCKAKGAGLYMICTLAKDQAMANGMDDALMLDFKGRVAECTGAHVFFTRANKGEWEIHTPTGDILLDGITRNTVIQLARLRGYTVHERDIYPGELDFFEECFVTGTAAEVTPVRQIGDHSFTPGPICEALIEDYDACVHGRIAVESGWKTSA